MVKARDAHPELPRQAVDPQRLVELPAEPLDGFRDAVGLAAQERQVTEPVSLFSHQQPVAYPPRDQRPQDPASAGAPRSRTRRTTASSRSASSGLTSSAARRLAF